MNLKINILLFTCLGLSLFAFYSGYHITPLNTSEITFTKGVVENIRRYDEKTEYFLKNNNSIVFETTSLTQPLLNAASIDPYKIGAEYTIGHQAFDSWKQQNDEGYLRREIVVLTVEDQPIITLEAFNDSERSNKTAAYVVGGFFLVAGIGLVLIFRNKDRFSKRHSKH